jgi:hypothetical protein
MLRTHRSHRPRTLVTLVTLCLLALSLAACATTTGTERTGGPQGYAQNPAEAKAQIDAVAAKNPALQVDASAPASVAEAVEILRQDAFFRFDATSAYLAAQPGVDALTLRALIEYAAADVNHSLAKVVEQRVQRDREAADLLARQKEAGTADAAAEKRTAELQARADEGARIGRALKILYEHHLGLAKTLSEQAMAEYSQSSGGFLARAGVARLERDWLAFDTRIQQVEAMGKDGIGVEYMHAMERLDRFADPEGSATRLHDVLAKEPGFVRAQAKLLLTATDIEQVHAELQALRALSPHHLMVAVLGPAIDEEYRVAMEIRGATQGAAAPATPAPAQPAPAPAPAP